MGLPSSLAEVLVQLAALKPLIPTYSHLLVSALFPIYIGAHASLSRPSSAAKPPRSKEDGSEPDDDEEEEGSKLQKMEGMEPSDAIMFPVMAGSVLGGLYFLIKWLEDPSILNKILSWYFSQAGILFAVTFVKDGFSVLKSFVFPSQYSASGKVWKADQEKRAFVALDNEGSTEHIGRLSPLPGILGDLLLPGFIVKGLWYLRGVVYQRANLRAYIRSLVEIKGRFTITDVMSILVAFVAVGYFTFVTKPWWLTNFLGFSFSYGALQFMSPTTFATGSLILGSLFFYDIYFVFFTPLMVTVAKQLDIPIKLLFPRPPAPGEDSDALSLAMLGLGDIVIPGMVIGLALRFDLFMFYKRKALSKAKNGESEAPKIQYVNATGGWGERFWSNQVQSSSPPESRISYYEAKSFPKTYFRAGIFGYVVGMVATLLAMQVSSHPQPALLYLVPGVLGSLWTSALWNGDIHEMWNFSDAAEEEGKNDKAAAEKEAEKPSSQSLFGRIFSGNTTLDASSGQKKSTADASNTFEKSDKDKKDEKSKDNGEIISFSVTLAQRTGSKPADNKTDEDTHGSDPKNPEDGN